MFTISLLDTSTRWPLYSLTRSFPHSFPTVIKPRTQGKHSLIHLTACRPKSPAVLVLKRSRQVRVSTTGCIAHGSVRTWTSTTDFPDTTTYTAAVHRSFTLFMRGNRRVHPVTARPTSVNSIPTVLGLRQNAVKIYSIHQSSPS